MRTGPEKVLKFVAIAMGGIVVLMAAIELQDAVKKERAAPVAEAPDELETDTACRAAWADNRRRFFDGAPPPELDE